MDIETFAKRVTIMYGIINRNFSKSVFEWRMF